MVWDTHIPHIWHEMDHKQHMCTEVEDVSDAVLGDFNALSLLEYHLVSNSAKFTDSGQAGCGRGMLLLSSRFRDI